MNCGMLAGEKSERLLGLDELRMLCDRYDRLDKERLAEWLIFLQLDKPTWISKIICFAPVLVVPPELPQETPYLNWSCAAGFVYRRQTMQLWSRS